MENEAVAGCLLGMAVGDALGLPYERLHRSGFERRLPRAGQYWFLFGRGMVSDDTEHACMTAQAVIAAGGDPEPFARSLAWRLRFWLLGLPAGAGSATLRGIAKLWLGFPPERSGVNSAGNGPSMRSPVLGVLFAQDWERCRDLVRRSTEMTHSDRKAGDAALAVALAAGLAATADGAVTVAVYRSACDARLAGADLELREILERVFKSVDEQESTTDFAGRFGQYAGGVSGYSLHTVPVALHAWLTHPSDLRAAVVSAIRCGGDTDTVAAIAGGIVGAAVGRGGIPRELLEGLMEWPCGVAWMERLAERSADAARSRIPGKPLPFNVPGQIARSLVFLVVVLIHAIVRGVRLH